MGIQWVILENDTEDRTMKGTGRSDLHDHAEHHEDIPQGDEDPEVSEAQ